MGVRVGGPGFGWISPDSRRRKERRTKWREERLRKSKDGGVKAGEDEGDGRSEGRRKGG